MAAQALKISEVKERELRRRAGQYTRPYREVIRAKIVLLAAEGLSCGAAGLHRSDGRQVAKSRVRGWRDWTRGLGRVGRGRFPPAEIAEVKALACELPAQTGRPLSRWSAAGLPREAVARGIVRVYLLTPAEAWCDRLIPVIGEPHD